MSDEPVSIMTVYGLPASVMLVMYTRPPSVSMGCSMVASEPALGRDSGTGGESPLDTFPGCSTVAAGAFKGGDEFAGETPLTIGVPCASIG